MTMQAPIPTTAQRLTEELSAFAEEVDEFLDISTINYQLELQRRHPTDRVVLLTGDVNFLAKADIAGIPTADTPDPALG